jgi:hypothetical protein
MFHNRSFLPMPCAGHWICSSPQAYFKGKWNNAFRRIRRDHRFCQTKHFDRDMKKINTYPTLRARTGLSGRARRCAPGAFNVGLPQPNYVAVWFEKNVRDASGPATKR